MKRIAVFIATTAGPVRIERITRERAPQSIVCLKRSATVLPISAAYDNFVRPGSGVIERVFGPFEAGAFRLDLSAPVEAGESWQLGAFLAHALVPSDGGPLPTADEADVVAWVSGRVDHDLAVGGVGHIAEKVHTAMDALQAWRASGRTVRAFVPEGDDYAALLAAGLPAGIEITPVRTAAEMLRALGCDRSGGAGVPALSAAALPRPTPRVSRVAVLAAAAAALAALSVAEGVLHTLRPPARESAAGAVSSAQAPDAATPAPSLTRVALLERRAPPGRTCADVQFGNVPAVETSVGSGTAVTTSRLPGLCGLGIAVDNGVASRFVDVSVDVLAGRLMPGSKPPQVFGGTAAFVGRAEWAIDLPRRMPGPFEIRVTAASAERPLAEAGRPEQGAVTAVLQHRVVP